MSERLTGRQRWLVGHAAALIAAMLVLVPWLTASLGGPAGYLASLAVYWAGFCLPVALIHLRPAGAALWSPRLPKQDRWLPALIAAQVAAVFAFGLVPHLGALTPAIAGLAIAMALVNGTLEEAAWRGGFLASFADRPRLGFWLGWALFAAWHVPLALANGIVYDGGPLALVGGAAGLGLIWTWVAWRSGSLFWVVAAHVLTNLFAFPGLLVTNRFL